MANAVVAAIVLGLNRTLLKRPGGAENLHKAVEGLLERAKAKERVKTVLEAIPLLDSSPLPETFLKRVLLEANRRKALQIALLVTISSKEVVKRARIVIIGTLRIANFSKIPKDGERARQAEIVILFIAQSIKRNTRLL